MFILFKDVQAKHADADENNFQSLIQKDFVGLFLSGRKLILN